MSARPKVLVAMSGGVDSSVAAAILQEQGYDVVGCFMRLGSPGETLDELLPAPATDAACNTTRIGHQGCCSITDAADARQVAAQLGIPLYVCNFKKDFGRIMDYFVDEYANGRTPNPCVRCNDWLKFGKLHDYARQIGADFVASGHYARVDNVRLLRGLDHSKDQSYVLFGVPRARLSEMLLPIGGMLKPAVRELAKQLNLPVFNKPDSQEICFIPDNDYATFVERRRPDLAAAGVASSGGNIVDSSGAIVGEHQGQHRFTIGQRRGIPLSLGRRVYITARDAKTNTIQVGSREDLATASCTVGEANWLIDSHDVIDNFSCLAMHRYNTRPVPARVSRLADSDRPTHSGRRGRFRVQFEQSQTAVAPGQALVLYAGDAVVGGGWIESTA
jgi:tRNA-uridine 2-sulfurtransferase